MKHFTIKLSLAVLFFAANISESLSQISGTNSVLTVTPNTATVVDDALKITQTGNIENVNVHITEGFASGDILGYTGSLPSGVISSYNSNLGILYFSGTTSASNWQTLLRTVTIKTTTTSCYSGKRNVTFLLGNAFYNPSNGHYYILNNFGAWSHTKPIVEASTYYGRQGYFATITNNDENNFIFGIVEYSTFPYIGASDDYLEINAATGTTTYSDQAASEGNFYWISGPEKGTQITSGGTTISGAYSNWLSNQPDDYPNISTIGEENYIQFYSNNAQWNDYTGTLPYNCVAEYGDMPNDAQTNNVGHATRKILINSAPSGTISGYAYVCTGSSSATFTLVPPPGGYSSVTRWESSVDRYFTNPRSITNTSTTLNLSNLAADSFYRAIVNTSTPTCSNLPTPSSKVVLNNSNGSWKGSISRNWNANGNWCGGIPTLSTDVIISTGMEFNPNIASGVTATCRNLTLNPNSLLNDSGLLQITGAITNTNGTLNASYVTSTVEFKGSSAQIIPTSVPFINNIKINNSTGVQLESNLSMDGLLTLTSGILDVKPGRQLTMGENATVSGGSNSSHVSGKIVKKGNSQFLFPIGKKGKYAPCELAGGYPTMEDFSAEYFKEPFSNLNISGVSAVSRKECWLIDHLTNGNVGTNISLHSYDTTFSGISNASSTNNLIIAYFNTSNQYWEDLGGGKSINILPGGLKATMSVSKFGMFTFGSSNGLNALPVKLINFVAIPDNIAKTVELNWENATEENSKYYDVLHSVDFKNWTPIGKVNAKGTGSTYSFIHQTPSQVNHYKLKEVSNDGNYSYSDIKLAKFIDLPTDRISIYPNPSGGTLTIANAGEDTNYEITDLTGKLIQSGNFNKSTEIQNLPKGIYILRLVSDSDILNEKIVIQ